MTPDRAPPSSDSTGGSRTAKNLTLLLQPYLFSSQRSEILLVTSEFRRLVRRQRNVASQYVFGTLSDAIDEFLVALLHVLSLGFVAQLIYTFQYRQ